MNRKHLKDVVDKIDCIILMNNVRDYHFTTNEDVSLYEDEQDIEIYPEENLLNLTDSQLALIPTNQVHTFTNTELLDRIYKIDSNKLSIAQIQALKNYYNSCKVIMDKSDVEDFLRKLKMCDLVVVTERRKNLDFIARYHLGNDEILNILKQVKASDYVENRRSINIGHLGDNLIIFEPSVIVIDGERFTGLIIYIKIDIDESNGNTYVVISFHDTNKQDFRPYA